MSIAPDPAELHLEGLPARSEEGLACRLTFPGGGHPITGGRAVTTLALGGRSTLPLAPATIATIRLARVLERLDLAAIFQLLLECQRVLEPGGQLIVELPDFDAALDAWRRGDAGFFGVAAGERGPSEALDELDARATAQFCTYRRRDPAHAAPDGHAAHLAHAAYDEAAPPRLPRQQLHALRDRCSPLRLAVELCAFAVDAEPPIQLERQNAWSRDELRELLRLAGFALRAERRTNDAGLRVVTEAIAIEQDFGSALDAASAAAHYRLHWHRFTRALRAAHPELRPSASFVSRGRHVGQVPKPLIAALREALQACPIVAVTAEDSAPGYLFNANLSAEGLQIINRDNRYWALEPHALRAMAPVLAALAEPVRACLGTPWRVVNLRAWKTRSSAARVEANGWHRDEPYPPMVLKILLYLTEAGPELGTTEVVLPDGSRACAAGPPGTFQIFENFALLHRGAPPRHGERWAVEITAAPYHRDDLRPVCAGQNADFPFDPQLPLEAWMPLER